MHCSPISLYAFRTQYFFVPDALYPLLHLHFPLTQDDSPGQTELVSHESSISFAARKIKIYEFTGMVNL